MQISRIVSKNININHTNFNLYKNVIKIGIFILAIMLNIPNAAAFQCNSTSYCSVGAGGGDTYPAGNCKNSYNVYFSSPQGDCYIMGNCSTCKSGYTLVNQDINSNWFSYCDNKDVLPTTQATCECICNNCSNTGWTALRIGYQVSYTRHCDCSSGSAQCITKNNYRCAAGYYGSSTNGTSGCTKCPVFATSSGNYTGTSAAGSTSITKCYIPSGTSPSDSTGKYQFTQNCYYTN